MYDDNTVILFYILKLNDPNFDLVKEFISSFVFSGPNFPSFSNFNPIEDEKSKFLSEDNSNIF